MSELTDLTELEEMGPIDYLLVEWSETRPHREIAPQLAEVYPQFASRVFGVNAAS